MEFRSIFYDDKIKHLKKTFAEVDLLLRMINEVGSA